MAKRKRADKDQGVGPSKRHKGEEDDEEDHGAGPSKKYKGKEDDEYQGAGPSKSHKGDEDDYDDHDEEMENEEMDEYKDFPKVFREFAENTAREARKKEASRDEKSGFRKELLATLAHMTSDMADMRYRMVKLQESVDELLYQKQKN